MLLELRRTHEQTLFARQRRAGSPTMNKHGLCVFRIINDDVGSQLTSTAKRVSISTPGGMDDGSRGAKDTD